MTLSAKLYTRFQNIIHFFIPLSFILPIDISSNLVYYICMESFFPCTSIF
uniref:Uncharacterized protein n=1 Tax=Siphoviridae sp. ctiMP24 TaxID=2825621 RepID=A0A8S5P1E7_9CAUD|nr:MAG TPA: hypothetical protein [Siphoviridae sp. ctiMP24]